MHSPFDVLSISAASNAGVEAWQPRWALVQRKQVGFGESRALIRRDVLLADDAQLAFGGVGLERGKKRRKKRRERKSISPAPAGPSIRPFLAGAVTHLNQRLGDVSSRVSAAHDDLKGRPNRRENRHPISQSVDGVPMRTPTAIHSFFLRQPFRISSSLSTLSSPGLVLLLLRVRFAFARRGSKSAEEAVGSGIAFGSAWVGGKDGRTYG